VSLFSRVHGRARAILIVGLLLAAAVGAFFVGAWVREWQEPARERAVAPASATATLKPAPQEPARSEPVPEPAPRRVPRPPKPEAAPAEAPVTGTLRIDSDVPGASVFIDRVYVGTTPVTAKDVAVGRHRLNVSAAGYDGYADEIQVDAGDRDVMVRFKEVHLDAAIAVIHKHRFGSCRGRLVATPEGIRYETTDRDDVFSAPLTALETFELDYMKKNLRIKPKGGKIYNFSDPEDNADRLFVFHRDVEKARGKSETGGRR
jgi:hypothetical protein